MWIKKNEKIKISENMKNFQKIEKNQKSNKWNFFLKCFFKKLIVNFFFKFKFQKNEKFSKKCKFKKNDENVQKNQKKWKTFQKSKKNIFTKKF